jgi:hypothetical protein
VGMFDDVVERLLGDAVERVFHHMINLILLFVDFSRCRSS